MVLSTKDFRMARNTPDTDFGFRRVPLGDKQTLVDDVFHSVARRYDLMNDLMSGGLASRLEGGAGHRGEPAPRRFGIQAARSGRRHGRRRLSRRDAGGPGTRVTVADINAEMLAVGRERAAKSKRNIEFIEANAERSFRCPTRASTPSHRVRHPQCAAHRRGARRSHRVLKIGGRFLCLEFSSVDVPGLDRLYDLYSFNVIRRSAAR